MKGTLRIATGVFLGLLAFGIVATVFERIEQQRALEAFNAEVEKLSKDPDPMGLGRTA